MNSIKNARITAQAAIAALSLLVFILTACSGGAATPTPVTPPATTQPTATAFPMPTPTPTPTPTPDSRPDDGLVETWITVEPGGSLVFRYPETGDAALYPAAIETLAQHLTPVDGETSIFALTAPLPAAHPLTAVLLSGRVRDAAGVVHAAPLSWVILAADAGDSIAPIAGPEVACAGEDGAVWLYQPLDAARWQFAGVIAAHDGRRYDYDAARLALVAGEEVYELAGAGPGQLRAEVAGFSLTIPNPDARSGAAGVLATSELAQQALNFLERLKTQFDVTGLGFDTVNLRFASAIWHMICGALTSLDAETTQTFTASTGNYVYVAETVQGPSVLQLNIPLEAVVAENGLSLNPDAYYFESVRKGRGSMTVRAIPLDPTDETELVLQIAENGEVTWAEVVEVSLNMDEVLHLGQYVSVLDAYTERENHHTRIRTLGNHRGLQPGNFVGRDESGEISREYAAQQFWLEFMGLIQDKPMHLVSINKIQQFAAEDTSGEDEIIINAWNANPDLMAIDSVSLAELLNAPGGVEIIGISQDLVVDKGSVIDPADRYLNLTLTNANGQAIAVRTAHLMSIRTDDGTLQVRSGAIYKDPAIGKITVILITGIDGAGTSVENYTFLASLITAGVLTAEETAVTDIAQAMTNGHPERNFTRRISEEFTAGIRAATRIVTDRKSVV